MMQHFAAAIVGFVRFVRFPTFPLSYFLRMVVLSAP